MAALHLHARDPGPVLPRPDRGGGARPLPGDRGLHLHVLADHDRRRAHGGDAPARRRALRGPPRDPRRLLPLHGRVDRARALGARRAVLRPGARPRPGPAPVRGHAAGGGVVHLDGDDLPRRGPGLRERGGRLLRGQRGEPARGPGARPLARHERAPGRLPARPGRHPVRAVRARRARAHRGARAGDGGSHQRLRPLPRSDRGRAPLQRGDRGGPHRVLDRADRAPDRRLVSRLALRHPDLPVLPFGRAVARHLPRQRRDRLLRSLPGVLRRGHQARHPAAGAGGQAGHDRSACATACAACWWSRAR